MDNLLPKLHHGLAPFFDKPFMFFGHSLGALLGFELARRLQAHGGPMPRHLLAAAFRAPRLPSGHPDLHGLSNPEFIEAFIRFEGIPKEIAQHKELLELLAITAKKDFQIHETWVYQPGSPLVCPITAFGGQDDPFVRPEMLDDWGHETSANFRKQLFSGGHHFVQEHIAPIIQEIKACAAALAG
jgi:medium-chain acyl-[acyl-carrier-protein] hydrolase